MAGQKRRAGGSAAIGGFAFQDSVAAWFATRILAEKSAKLPWGLPDNAYLEYLRCETDEPVDDVLVGTSDKGLIFVQVKRSVRLSDKEDSALSSAFDQFVRQYWLSLSRSGRELWERPLDVGRDRLVLITGGHAPTWATNDLPMVLKRIRMEPQLTDVADAGQTKTEKRVLKIVLDHLARSSLKATGKPLEGAALRQLLSLIWIDSLDLDRGGRDELAAINWLKIGVLRNPDEGEAAYRVIEGLCKELGKARTGTDLSGLQKELLKNGILLRVPLGLRADVETLGNYTRETLENLEQLGVISVGQSVVKIQRPCLSAVEEAAKEGHLLVIGDPGSGKSGLLHDLANRLMEQGSDVVFLAAEHVEATTTTSLQNELLLEHGFPEVLAQWPGQPVGFLLIDALDAARSGYSVRMLVDLIRRTVRLGGRWHIIATIRKFDLRYQSDLRDIFSGEPVASPEPDPEFRKVRHLNVPEFDELELAQIRPQCPGLWTLIENAKGSEDQTLYRLLHDPFNLRIAGSLVGAGVAGANLGPVQSKIDLLERYWDLRIIDSTADSNGHAREELLRIICEKMVERQLLTIDVAETNPSANSAHLNNLKSKKVLVEWRKTVGGQPQRNTIAFAHHVLFDYAVEKVLLNAPEGQILEQIIRRPSITLSIRPSFVFHFQRNWVRDERHTDFWDLTIALIRDARVPKIGQLTGPAVAVDLATKVDDFGLLIEWIGSEDEGKKHTAEDAFGHIAGTLLAKNETLVGPASRCPWCEVVAECSAKLTLATAGSVRVLLNAITAKPELLNENESQAAGRAARNLLEFALDNPDAGVKQWLLPVAISSVCRTFGTCKNASSVLIRRVLKGKSLEDQSYVEGVWWLAREIQPLLQGDPKLAASAYLCIMDSEQPEDKPVSLYPSRIMHLSTTLKQNYSMAQHCLAESFGRFLDVSLPYAIRVLVRVIEWYARRGHGAREEPIVYTFDFSGQRARFVGDLSCVWDEGRIYQHDPPAMMLDALSSYLDGLGSSSAGSERVPALVALIVRHNRTGAIWRRLLASGAKHPETIGKTLYPLLKAPLLLVTPDTCTEAGNMLRRVHPLLTDPQKQEIEDLILRLPTIEQVKEFSHLEYHQARLLACIPEASFVTTQAKDLVQSLAARGELPQNEPSFQVESNRGIYTRENWWHDQGIQIDEPANAALTAKMEPVHEFNQRFLNGTPEESDAQKIMPHLQGLLAALHSATQDGVDTKIGESAADDLAQACSILVRSDEFLDQEQDLAFVRDILLEFSAHPSPEFDPARNDQFDSMPSWGGGPRAWCAEGLMLLTRKATNLTTDIRASIQRLTYDPVNAVRYMVVRRLTMLHETDPDLMWRLVDDRVEHEKSGAVLRGLVAQVLHRLTGLYASRTIRLAETIFDEVKPAERRIDPQEACVSLFVDAFVHLNDQLAEKILFTLTEDVASSHKHLRYIVSILRDVLTPVETKQGSEVYLRAWDLTNRICETSVRKWNELNVPLAQGPSHQSASEQLTRDLENTARLVDSLAMQIYFASKAHEQGKGLSDNQKKQFLGSAQRSLDLLQDVGLPSVAHHLIEMLQSFIEVDPRGVFIRIANIVLSASDKGGYQYESLAADLLVDIMGYYIAGHKEIFRQDSECQRLLIRVLDTFVMWPNARKLVYRLEDVYR